MTINDLLAEYTKDTEPYTREQFDADHKRVVARICEKHGIQPSEIDALIREHRYVHDEEDIEDEYIWLLAVSRATGWTA